MKIGYKGLTADMKAVQGGYSGSKETYEVGKIYSKENIEKLFRYFRISKIKRKH